MLDFPTLLKWCNPDIINRVKVKNNRKVSARLILAFITSLLDEAIIVAILLWGLPRLGINIPLPGLIVIMLAFAVYAVVSFRFGSRILSRKPVEGLSSMVGTEGKVVISLAPEGSVTIHGELWNARAESGAIESGEAVTVVGQDGLKLIVRKADSDTGKPA